MKSTVSNSSLTFIIVFWVLMGVGSGCATHPIKPHPGPEAQSGSVQPLPYRVDGRVYYPLNNSSGFVQNGIASWYGRDFHGKLTSNGEVYNMNSLTAAHKTLPFNSIVLVTHRKSGKSVTVRINDRGPFVGDRIIDLSFGAANKLGMVETGTAPVDLRVIRGARSSAPSNAAGASAKKGVYSVQVGVFEDLDNAREISHQLNNGRIYTVKQSNRKLYKVLVGKYSNYEKALKPMDQMRLQGFEEAFIVLSP
jgi:peptidoglycan lytic transglycosylase